MPTPTKGPRLGGSPAHERLILANLATALFEHGRITTTEAKAKRLRPLAERLITFAKRGDLAARRRVMTVVRDKGVVHVLFAEIGPRYQTRQGGYTRILKLGPRKGDNAPMALIELVEPLPEQAVAEATAATKRAAKEKAAKSEATETPAAVAETVASDETVSQTDAPEAVDAADESADVSEDINEVEEAEVEEATEADQSAPAREEEIADDAGESAEEKDDKA